LYTYLKQRLCVLTSIFTWQLNNISNSGLYGTTQSSVTMRSPTTQVYKARRRYLGYPSPDAVVWACRDFGNRRKQLPFLPLSRQPAAALQSHGLCIMHFLTIACKRGWVVGLGISAQIKPSICLAQITLTSRMIKMWACGKPRACIWRHISAI